MVLALNARQQQELERAAPRLDESASRLGQTESRLVGVERELGETHQNWRSLTMSCAHCVSNAMNCAEWDDAAQAQAAQQEELRVLRSDKESAQRAVASLRQQLQEAKAERAGESVTAAPAPCYCHCSCCSKRTKRS
jgi:sugar-specific transcriptional regulator TrmB